MLPPHGRQRAKRCARPKARWYHRRSRQGPRARRQQMGLSRRQRRLHSRRTRTEACL